MKIVHVQIFNPKCVSYIKFNVYNVNEFYMYNKKTGPFSNNEFWFSLVLWSSCSVLRFSLYVYENTLDEVSMCNIVLEETKHEYKY